MADLPPDETPELLTPAEAANILEISARAVTRLARAGRLTTIRTLGGHRRFLLREVLAITAASSEPKRDTR